jgi:hypothetical protein
MYSDLSSQAYESFACYDTLADHRNPIRNPWTTCCAFNRELLARKEIGKRASVGAFPAALPTHDQLTLFLNFLCTRPEALYDWPDTLFAPDIPPAVREIVQDPSTFAACRVLRVALAYPSMSKEFTLMRKSVAYEYVVAVRDLDGRESRRPPPNTNQTGFPDVYFDMWPPEDKEDIQQLAADRLRHQAIAWVQAEGATYGYHDAFDALIGRMQTAHSKGTRFTLFTMMTETGVCEAITRLA